ncbi:MAG: hypothetical protein Ct9H300mP9_0960 [Candidatus Neomarinimicrobiota bacterium]|nr:MAG: hypothetical protein Ct9H300mP9_0960 [Candidatus Neomarinimicrobiota bacterium]
MEFFPLISSKQFCSATVLSYFYERFKIVSYSLAFLNALSRFMWGTLSRRYSCWRNCGIFAGLGKAYPWVMIKMRELKRGRFWVWYDSTVTPKV